MNIHVDLLKLTQRVEALEKQLAEFNAALEAPESEKKPAPAPEPKRKTG